MACSVAKMAMVWGGYSAASSVAEVFIPCGGWMDAGNITAARGWGELRGKTGAFQGKPAVQVANDVRSPGAATAVGAAITSDSVSDPGGMDEYLRVGWLVSLTTGSSLGTGNLAGVVELVYG
jgi:hypothetical protein